MAKGLADVNQYFALVRSDLEDALGAQARLVQTNQIAAYRRPDPRTVRLRVPLGDHVVELTRRAPVFSGDEAKLLSAYGTALQEFGEVPRVFATTASEDVLTRAIAVRCSSTGSQAKAVETVIQSIVRHASRTYEGIRIAVNICLDLNDTESGIGLSDFLLMPWTPILGSGLSSAILLAGNGSVLRVMSLSAVNTDNVLAPEVFAPVAYWTNSPGRVAISVSRAGDIYLFSGGQLLLARRSARWRGFPVSALRASGWFGTSQRTLTPRVKTAVLTSLIDASAGHHGACLGIVINSRSVSAIENLVSIDERWNSDRNERRKMFQTVSFLDLSRRHRLELLSMDGATLLDQSGMILAAGAILTVGGGSPGGGRTAAARAISSYGVGIKVSQDGPVTAYVNEGGNVLPHFSLG